MKKNKKKIINKIIVYKIYNCNDINYYCNKKWNKNKILYYPEKSFFISFEINGSRVSSEINFNLTNKENFQTSKFWGDKAFTSSLEGHVKFSYCLSVKFKGFFESI